tara:strand:- start:476 stop:781 length:306 start_codon:yes stop_codon:yes gene_type:complete
MKYPKTMDEVLDLIMTMPGCKDDLARVSIASNAIGFMAGVDAAETAIKKGYSISEARANRDKMLDAMADIAERLPAMMGLHDAAVLAVVQEKKGVDKPETD